MSHRKPKNKGGRPCRFDETGAATLIAAMFAAKKSIVDVSRATGIGVSTLGRWLHDGRQGDPKFALLADLADASIAHRLKFASFAKIKRYLRSALGPPRRFRA